MLLQQKKVAPQALDVRQRLLNWYGKNLRSLPWRSEPTPYHVLVSEFMLQQTRVETVVPYFENFVSRWPTLKQFATANIEDVLQAWSGLGYYSRARRLHQAAQICVQSGGVPQNLQDLLALPGVGPYTAGAIASIAFDQRAPAVDGNVERVLSRVLAIAEDPRAKQGKQRILQFVQRLLEQGSARDLNQALMELGALVCKPKSPNCAQCPLTLLCVARATGRVHEFPIRSAKAPPLPIRGACGILRSEQGVLLGRRRTAGLLAGLWEPIGTDWDLQKDVEPRLRQAFADRVGIVVADLLPIGEVSHVFSHRKLTLVVYDVTARQPCQPTLGEGYDELRWSEEARDLPLPLSKLAKKTLAMAGTSAKE